MSLAVAYAVPRPISAKQCLRSEGLTWADGLSDRPIALVDRSVGGIAARSAADGCECRAEVPRSTPRTHWELAHISRA